MENQQGCVSRIRHLFQEICPEYRVKLELAGGSDLVGNAVFTNRGYGRLH